jgi:RHS repeat-associated protein
MHIINERTGGTAKPQPMLDTRETMDWDRDYFAFGSDRDNAIGAANDYKFTGNDYDPETGLYYIWHRYYRSGTEIRPVPDDPELGRFTQVDPKWDTYPGWSPYAYALNNPLKYVDPTGKEIYLAQEFQQNSTAMAGLAHMRGTNLGSQLYSVLVKEPSIFIALQVGNLSQETGGRTTWFPQWKSKISQELGVIPVFSGPDIHTEQIKKGQRVIRVMINTVLENDSPNAISKIVYHELKSHIANDWGDTRPESVDHRVYGESSVGEAVRPGSDAARYHEEANQLDNTKEKE